MMQYGHPEIEKLIRLFTDINTAIFKGLSINHKTKQNRNPGLAFYESKQLDAKISMQNRKHHFKPSKLLVK